eukprot:6977560-Pyramimonas_sp.AAC.1
MHACPECKGAPARPNDWARCAGDAAQGQSGGTTGSGGHWRCPAGDCFHRWGREEDGTLKWATRLLVPPSRTMDGVLPQMAPQEVQRLEQETSAAPPPEAAAHL